MSKSQTFEGVFTPRLPDGSRLHLILSPVDMKKTDRGRAWCAEVTDTVSGLKFEVAGADCGSRGCFCDAIVVRKLPR